jgi:tetratricopeptide (TPR) repeat protein
MSLAAKRFRRLTTGFAAVALVALAGCDSVEDRVERHYARGIELVEAGEPARAGLEFRNAARLDGNHAPTRYELGRLQEAEGDLRGALGNYRLAAELDSSLVDANLRAAQILLLANQLEDAAGHIDAALAVDPTNHDGLVLRAQALRSGGDVAGSREIVDAVLAEDPDHQAANLVIVADLVDGGEVAAALARLGVMIEKDPDSLSLEILRLQLLARDTDRAPLLAALRTAVDRFPDQTELRQSLAQELLSSGDATGAEDVLREIADRADSHEPAMRLVSFIASTRGIDAARAELDQRRAAAPADSESARVFEMALAELDLRGGDTEAGRARLRALIDAESTPGAANAARVMLARSMVATGEIEAAAAVIDQALSLDEGFIDALKLRAEIEISEERLEQAIATLRRALDVAPDDVGVIVLEARAHQRLGNAGIAGERLGRATRLSNFDPQIVRLYVRHLMDANQLTAAAGILEEASRRDPNNVAILTALADVRVRLQDWAGVEEIVGRLRGLEGGDAAARQIDAVRLFGEGRSDESISMLEALVEEQVGGVGAVSRLIAAWVSAGEIDRAETYLDDQLAENPDQPMLSLMRAELHLIRGDAAAARAAVERVVAERPDVGAGHEALTRLLIATGDIDGAVTAARTGVERAPSSGGLRLMLAGLLERVGDWDGAIEQYAALYRAAPDSVVLANNYASLLAEHRADDPESMALAARIAERLRDSTQPEFLDTYGWIRFLSGDINAALRALTPAAEGLPDNALVQYHAGRAFAAAGQESEARELLEAALSIDPDFKRAESARQALAALSATSQ